MAEERPAGIAAIIDALIAGARERKLAWEWRADSGQSVAELASGRVAVEKDRDNDTVVTIMDIDGNALAAVNVGFREHADLKGRADELHTLARRSALQADSKLAAILHEITE